MGHTERIIVGGVGACLIGSSVLLNDNWWWWLITLGGVIVVVLALFIKKSETTSDRTGTGLSIHEKDDEIPVFMSPVFASSVQEMQQLGPHSWLTGFGPKDPEVTLRAVVALPAVSASAYSGELASAMTGDPRESFLIDLLESSEFTKWLRQSQPSMTGSPGPTWHIRGWSFAETTELVFAPSMNSTQVWPFLARCAVQTGWRAFTDDVKQKAIRFLVELQFNGWSSSQFQVNEVKEEPIAKKLTLEEIAEDFIELAQSLSLSSVVAQHLIPEADVSKGYFGLWLTVRGLSLIHI